MPSITLTDAASLRLQSISFFLLVFLIATLAVRWIWNSFRPDFPRLPHLSYGKAAGLVGLWGLVFLLILVMISGARELMTPGAWKKDGLTYSLEDAKKPAGEAKENEPTEGERRARLKVLFTSLAAYALEHEGQFPPQSYGAISVDLWKTPHPSGMRYVYLSGRTTFDPWAHFGVRTGTLSGRTAGPFLQRRGEATDFGRTHAIAGSGEQAMTIRSILHYVGVGLLVLMVVFAIVCVGLIVLIEVPVTLAFGWVTYLRRVTHQVHPDPAAVTTAFVCLAGVTIGGHFFLRWLSRTWGAPTDGNTPNLPTYQWAWKRSLQLVSLIVLMFASGIAVTGVVHQTGWLLRSSEPILTNGFREYPRRAVSTNNLQQITLSAHYYYSAFNELPRSTFDPNGRSMHSWQTSLLPFLEYESLHHRIDQTKPWNDPANGEIMARQIQPYLNPSCTTHT